MAGEGLLTGDKFSKMAHIQNKRREALQDGRAPSERKAQGGACGAVHAEIEQEAAHCGDDHEC